MSEWWTYRLSDFLLFAPTTYYRLFELYNRAVWPLQVVTMLAGVVILVLAARRRGSEGRWIAAILAFLWLWVAWGFHLRRYATINWAAAWFAGGFALQAFLLIWIGVIRKGLKTSSPVSPPQWSGSGLFLFALVVEPLLGRLFGRPWMQTELFGIAPDPTAVATLGMVVFLGDRIRFSLLIIPMVWCAISGATLLAMQAPDALVLPVCAILTVVLALWRRRLQL